MQPPADETQNPEDIRRRLEELRASTATAGDEAQPDVESPAAPVPVDLQVIPLLLQNVNIGVGDTPDGRKLLVIGPFAVQLQIPIDRGVAGEVGAALTGGVHVPGLELDLGQLGLNRESITEAARIALEREGRRSPRPR
jgi:hypothetical protein